MALFLQVFVFTSFLITSKHCLSIEEEDTAFTDVQSSNIYCHSFRTYAGARKVVCDFRQTAARLGDAGLLKENDGVLNEDLHLEVRNCSRLLIASAFYSWRRVFNFLHLTIEDVHDVEQEDIAHERDSNQLLLPLGGLISLSLKKTRMNSLTPYLVSDTKVLLIDIQESQIGTICANAFRNVEKLWQLRIGKSNVSRIENSAMPDALLIGPRKVVDPHELTPFIFNETRFGILESDAIQLHITEKDEYFNIVNAEFRYISKGGIRISGSGHVLIADSQFDRIENDSVIIHLRGMDTASSHKLLAYSTLTLMGLDILSVNIDNFLLNLQITNGQQYLVRLNFRFPGALSSVIDLDNSTLSHIWSPKQTTFVKRWTVVCSCYDVGNSLHALADPDAEKTFADRENGTSSGILSEQDDPKPTEAFLAVVSSPHWPIVKELRCYKDDVNSISTSDYSALFCNGHSDTTENTNYPSAEVDQSSNDSTPTMFWCIGITTGCIIVTVAIVSLVAILKRRSKSCQIHNKQISAYRPNDVKQVGIISEDPLCGCDEAEEESQL